MVPGGVSEYQAIKLLLHNMVCISGTFCLTAHGAERLEPDRNEERCLSGYDIWICRWGMKLCTIVDALTRWEPHSMLASTFSDCRILCNTLYREMKFQRRHCLNHSIIQAKWCSQLQRISLINANTSPLAIENYEGKNDIYLLCGGHSTFSVVTDEPIHSACSLAVNHHHFLASGITKRSWRPRLAGIIAEGFGIVKGVAHGVADNVPIFKSMITHLTKNDANEAFDRFNSRQSVTSIDNKVTKTAEEYLEAYRRVLSGNVFWTGS
nr:hypothetical protein [Tanacetum cinerariifolium]